MQSALSGLQFLGESVYNAMASSSDRGALQKERAASMSDPLQVLEGYRLKEYSGYADEGREWSRIQLYDRRRLEQAGIGEQEWGRALAYRRYSERRDEVEDAYPEIAAMVERYRGMGVGFESLPDRVLDVLEGMGIRGYASGGVFSPNSPVLGVLGDNRREVEVAAPYSTIVRAVRDAMGLGGLGGGSARKIELTANMVIDGRTVARQIYPYMIEEGRRVGRTVRCP